MGPGERVELFDAGDGCVLYFFIGAVLVEGGVDLACAEDDTLNVLWVVDGMAMFWVRDDPSEVRIAGEVLNRRAGNRVAQERLAEEEYKS